MTRSTFKVVGGTEMAPTARAPGQFDWARLRFIITGSVIAASLGAATAWLWRHPPNDDQLGFFVMVGVVVLWAWNKLRVIREQSKLPIVGRVIVVHKRGFW